MEIATEKAGFEPDFAYLVFKNGVHDLVDFYAQDLDDKMVEIVKAKKIKSTTESVHVALFERIKLLSKNKTTAKKTGSFLMLPTNCVFSANLVWRTADRIWKDIVKDKSIDFNYYTKRGLLCTIYTSTTVYYLGDDDLTLKNTEDFLARRLKDVVVMGQTIGKFLRG